MLTFGYAQQPFCPLFFLKGIFLTAHAPSGSCPLLTYSTWTIWVFSADAFAARRSVATTPLWQPSIYGSQSWKPDCHYIVLNHSLSLSLADWLSYFFLLSPVPTAAAPATRAATVATAVESNDQCTDSPCNNYHVQPAGFVCVCACVGEREFLGYWLSDESCRVSQCWLSYVLTIRADRRGEDRLVGTDR